MAKRFLVISFCLVTVLFSYCVYAASMFHPRYNWYSIKTMHFWIHYHEGLEQEALRLAIIAEEVHAKLAKDIQWQPFFRTDVVLCDTTDMSNGFSMPFPYNRVQIFVVMPHVEDAGLSNTDNWLRMVFTHEYTHTLTIDMIGGIPALSRYTCGRMCFPNFLMPIWAIEGYPVLQESKEKPWGRLNANYTLMVLRQEVYSKNIKDISQASNFPREWPAGLVPYLYGGLFVEFCARNYPEKDFGEIFKENADNILPFLMEKNFNDVYGQRAIALWHIWQKELINDLNYKISEIKKRGVSNYTVLTKTGFYTIFPRFYNNDIVFVAMTNKEKPSLIKYDAQNKKFSRLAYVNMPNSLAISNGSIIVSDIQYYQSFDLFRDVYIFDTSYSQKTKGLRVQYIEPVQNGYVAIVYDKGKYSLIQLDASFSIQKYFIHNTPFQISYLRVLADSSKAVFSIIHNGFSDIALFDFTSEKMLLLTNDPYVDIHPTFHPDGNKVVFSSDRDGVFNLYEINLATKKISRISNVIGGAFFPDISSDGTTIVFSSYEANGYNIALMPYATGQSQELSPQPFTIQQNEEQKEVLKEPYNPLYSVIGPWWWPYVYSEELYTDKYDNHIGFYTGGNDTLYRHSYSLGLDWAFVQKRMSLVADYIYSGFFPDLFVSYKDEGIIVDDTFPWEPPDEVVYIRRTLERKVSMGISIPYQKFYNYNQLLLYYTYEKTKVSEYYKNAGVLEHDDVLAGSHVAFVHDGTYTGSFSVSPEDGMVFEAYGDIYHSSLASDISYSKVRSGVYYFLRGFENDVLAFMLRGGYAHNAPYYLYPYNLGRYAKGKRHSIPEDEDAYSMRGFAKDMFYGNRLAVGIVEYRIPLFQKDIGYRMLPLMLRDIWLTPFVEYGNIWIDSTSLEDFKYSVGSELHVRITAGYWADVEGFAGVVKGYGDYGEVQVYFGIATAFEGALKQQAIIRQITQ